MGIQGLHKGLAFATRKTTLQDFRGGKVAVDSSSWLHRSVYSVSEKYVESTEKGRVDPQCVRVSANYIISRCRELMDCFEIAQIFLVMDGKRCPLKADTNEERERKKQANLQEARECKRCGNKYKAVEKYKMCIKIKDDFTKAVMDEVAKQFRKDHRVHLVWSPYEADAQLAKLCVDGATDAVITEDSDVLVYSAAAQFSFPVIFKLDRKTGKCDVISMDWLLSLKDVPSSLAKDGKKQGTALETFLKSFSARQANRPGFGARLFVQGCVLAGCDYAPNRLTGVGLVNAFKYVRDNAHRDDSIRFQKILDSLPAKYKVDIDTRDYELKLAQSEAVFYYHMVRHPDKTIKPLCEPRTTDEATGDATLNHYHFPSMKRFGKNWSFLGQGSATEKCKGTCTPETFEPPVKEIVVTGKGKAAKMHKKTTLTKSDFSQQGSVSTHNPYLKFNSKLNRKRPREESLSPLSNLDPNSGLETKFPQRNIFASFAKSTSPGSGGIENYLKSKKDPRFVKRKFTDDQESSRMAAPEQGGHPAETACIPFEYEAVQKFPSDQDFQVAAARMPPTEESLADPSHVFGKPQRVPAFYDLTESRSADAPTNEDGIDGEYEDEDGFLLEDRHVRVSLNSYRCPRARSAAKKVPVEHHVPDCTSSPSKHCTKYAEAKSAHFDDKQIAPGGLHQFQRRSRSLGPDIEHEYGYGDEIGVACRDRPVQSSFETKFTSSRPLAEKSSIEYCVLHRESSSGDFFMKSHPEYNQAEPRDRNNGPNRTFLPEHNIEDEFEDRDGAVQPMRLVRTSLDSNGTSSGQSPAKKSSIAHHLPDHATSPNEYFTYPNPEAKPRDPAQSKYFQESAHCLEDGIDYDCEDEQGFLCRSRPARVSLDSFCASNDPRFPNDDCLDAQSEYKEVLPGNSRYFRRRLHCSEESNGNGYEDVCRDRSDHASLFSYTARAGPRIDQSYFDLNLPTNSRHKQQASTRTRGPRGNPYFPEHATDSNSDEVIESPDASDQYKSRYSSSNHASMKPVNLNTSYSSVSSGPLARAFLRQEKLASSTGNKSSSSQSGQWTREVGAPRSRSRASQQITLDSFFPQKAPRASGYHQLRCNSSSNQTEEDFLWDG